MEKLNTEIGWNQLRYDVRTYRRMSETEGAARLAGFLPDIDILAINVF